MAVGSRSGPLGSILRPRYAELHTNCEESMTMPAVPPPHPSTSVIHDNQQEAKDSSEVQDPMKKRIEEQAAQRKSDVANFKMTAMRVSATMEDINASTPAEPLRLPTPEELEEMTDAESVLDGIAEDEQNPVADAVMNPSDSHEDADSVDDGFAALRAQRAQRKKLMSEHKRTSMSVRLECRRATTGSYRRERKPVDGNDV